MRWLLWTAAFVALSGCPACHDMTYATFSQPGLYDQLAVLAEQPGLGVYAASPTTPGYDTMRLEASEHDAWWGEGNHTAYGFVRRMPAGNVSLRNSYLLEVATNDRSNAAAMVDDTLRLTTDLTPAERADFIRRGMESDCVWLEDGNRTCQDSFHLVQVHDWLDRFDLSRVYAANDWTTTRPTREVGLVVRTSPEWDLDIRLRIVEAEAEVDSDRWRVVVDAADVAAITAACLDDGPSGKVVRRNGEAILRDLGIEPQFSAYQRSHGDPSYEPW